RRAHKTGDPAPSLIADRLPLPGGRPGKHDRPDLHDRRRLLLPHQLPESCRAVRRATTCTGGATVAGCSCWVREVRAPVALQFRSQQYRPFLHWSLGAPLRAEALQWNGPGGHGYCSRSSQGGGLAPRIAWSPSGQFTQPASRPWHIRELELDAVWPHTRGENIIIGIIDGGVAEVPGLDAERVIWLDAKGMPTDPSDETGHGTACAGLAASSAPTIPGVAPEAHLLSFRTDGPSGGPELGMIEQALEHAVQLADVISCSFVMNQVTDRICNLMRDAHNAGVIVVGSAGN